MYSSFLLVGISQYLILGFLIKKFTFIFFLTTGKSIPPRNS